MSAVLEPPVIVNSVLVIAPEEIVPPNVAFLEASSVNDAFARLVPNPLVPKTR